MYKKLLVALVAVGAAASHAQSTLTLTGVIDAAVRRGTGSIGNVTSVGSGGIAGSRVIFRGVEDLGGGMSASFWLEAQFDSSNGVGTNTNTNNQASGTTAANAGLIFNRRSTVSIAGAWGEVRLGRDYTPQFWNVNAMDPFQTNGVGASNVLLYGQAGLVSARASNSIGYLTPRSDTGFYGQTMVYLGENAHDGSPTQNDGRGWAARIGHKAGAHDIALAHGRATYAAGDVQTTNLGASYDFGDLTMTGTYQRDRVSTGTGRGFLIGAMYDIGVGTVRASYSTYKRALAGNPESGKLALGYVHNLSKRTALYGTIAHVKNKGPAAMALADALTGPGKNSSGLELGVRHIF